MTSQNNLVSFFSEFGAKIFFSLKVRIVHIEKSNMHIQGIARSTNSFVMGLTSAEGLKLVFLTYTK